MRERMHSHEKKPRSQRCRERPSQGTRPPREPLTPLPVRRMHGNAPSGNPFGRLMLVMLRLLLRMVTVVALLKLSLRHVGRLLRPMVPPRKRLRRPQMRSLLQMRPMMRKRLLLLLPLGLMPRRPKRLLTAPGLLLGRLQRLMAIMTKRKKTRRRVVVVAALRYTSSGRTLPARTSRCLSAAACWLHPLPHFGAHPCASRIVWVLRRCDYRRGRRSGKRTLRAIKSGRVSASVPRSMHASKPPPPPPPPLPPPHQHQHPPRLRRLPGRLLRARPRLGVVLDRA